MKKIHHKSQKFHTIYNIIICSIFVIIIIFFHDISLIASTIFLLFYVTGNGLIHATKNELNRDTILEYMILSIIALIILVNTFSK